MTHPELFGDVGDRTRRVGLQPVDRGPTAVDPRHGRRQAIGHHRLQPIEHGHALTGSRDGIAGNQGDEIGP